MQLRLPASPGQTGHSQCLGACGLLDFLPPASHTLAVSSVGALPLPLCEAGPHVVKHVCLLGSIWFPGKIFRAERGKISEKGISK